MNALPKSQMYRVAMLLKARAELVEELSGPKQRFATDEEIGELYRLTPTTELSLRIRNSWESDHGLCGENLDRYLVMVGVRAIIAAIDIQLAAIGIEITDAVEKELDQ